MRHFDSRFVTKIMVFTFVLTWAVILGWEKWLQFPVFSWIQAHFPNNRLWVIEQRTEHFLISFAVDAVVVTILLRKAFRQKEALRVREERYRDLIEQTQTQDPISRTGAGNPPRISVATDGR